MSWNSGAHCSPQQTFLTRWWMVPDAKVDGFMQVESPVTTHFAILLWSMKIESKDTRGFSIWRMRSNSERHWSAWENGKWEWVRSKKTERGGCWEESHRHVSEDSSVKHRCGVPLKHQFSGWKSELISGRTITSTAKPANEVIKRVRQKEAHSMVRLSGAITAPLAILLSSKCMKQIP